MPAIIEFWISKSHTKLCREELDLKYPLESGGVFVGYWSDSGDAVVTKIIGPGPNALHGRRFFECDSEWQNTEIEKHYETTGGTETYLGDWHSHPDVDSGRLSHKDIRIMKKIIRSPLANTSNPIMAIFFGTPGRWNNSIWSAKLNRSRFLWKTIDLASLHVSEF